jgi:hypothetical protein
MATGLAAILAQPLRARLQRSVNRLMYASATIRTPCSRA